MRLRFAKMSGTGNDFVVIDDRRNRITRRKALARQLCDRHEGVGADGLLVVERSHRFHYTMKYYNADGSAGGMCGNGARCIAWFAYLRKIAPKNQRFDAIGKEYGASVLGRERISIDFPDPGPLFPAWKLRRKIKGLTDIAFIDTGSPHAVIRLPNGKLHGLPVKLLGPVIRRDRSFEPHGTNVNFIETPSSNRIHIRTYERGVEAETKACGTGSIACAVAGSKLWQLESPVRVTSSGGTLRVSFRKIQDGVTDVKLEGRARIVFEGEINV